MNHCASLMISCVDRVRDRFEGVCNLRLGMNAKGGGVWMEGRLDCEQSGSSTQQAVASWQHVITFCGDESDCAQTQLLNFTLVQH